MDEAVPAVGPEEADALVAAGALLLDVREPDEWLAGHARAATAMPMSTLDPNALPRDRRIVAVCRSGARSARVTVALAPHGFDVVNLAGGMQAWAAAGLEVTTDDGEPGAVI